MKSARQGKLGIKHVTDSMTTSSLVTPLPLTDSSQSLESQLLKIHQDLDNTTLELPKDTEDKMKNPNGNFDEDRLRAALFYVLDAMERAQLPFIVIGNIAYQMYNNLPLDDHKILIALKKEHCVKECISTLLSMTDNIETTTDGWRIVVNEVPVILHVMTKKFDVFVDPDTVFYSVEQFHIPNPFMTYWNGKENYEV